MMRPSTYSMTSFKRQNGSLGVMTRKILEPTPEESVVDPSLRHASGVHINLFFPPPFRLIQKKIDLILYAELLSKTRQGEEGR
jgi:hypothetical protein